jgi:DNA primase
MKTSWDRDDWEKIQQKSFYLQKNINLAEFIEEESGVSLQWSNRKSAKCSCPLPNHNENAPSFTISYLSNEERWAFYCFGCHEKGNIITYCQKYVLDNGSFLEAIKYLCEKYKIDDDDDTLLKINISQSKFDKNNKTENSNIVTSNICRKLLLKDFNKYKNWVLEKYKEIDEAVENEDYQKIENIGHMASEKIHE